MVDLSRVEASVLRKHAKAIVHMRSQKKERRFGLIFGAGIGKDLKLPNWDELVQRIAKHPAINGEPAIRDDEGTDQSLTIRIQKLFEWFRLNRKSPGETTHLSGRRHQEKALVAEWRKIVRECLYQTVIDEYTSAGIRDKHPYLAKYIEIIQLSEVTVNYNFDETVQLLILGAEAGSSSSRAYARKFRTISKGTMRPHALYPVIYHPNGYLPRNLLESTDQLVFTEESFADQLLQINQHKEDFLLNHFATKTCLFIGLSLNDANLKHLLRRSAAANPGQCHYYVCFNEGRICDEAKIAMRYANFQVYNLVTLFMNKEEIAALGSLISKPDDELRRGAEAQEINLKYLYYLTGTMGVGKSTCLSNLYSLTTYDEWTQERLPALAKDRKQLTEDEKTAVDEWLGEEFYRKNWTLSEESMGVHLVDRPPLDPLAFTDLSEWSTKARDLKKAIVKGRSRRRVQPGHVLLLTGDSWELHARIIAQNKESATETLEENQKYLTKIYDIQGVTKIETKSLGISEVVRRMASIIHLEEYVEADLQARLDHFVSDGADQTEFGF
jgi:hypothetical protein